MQVEEGGVTTNGSSDYVSGKLNAIASQRTEAERQIVQSYFQRTALLRAHLVALAAPIEELFSRFQVRELLGEAKALVGRSSRPIEELMPDIYRDIIAKPDPSKTVFNLGEPGKEVPVDISSLADPNNFQRLVPGLEGCSLKLSDITYASDKVLVTETYYDIVLRPFEWPSSMGVGYGTNYSGGGSDRVLRTCKRLVIADVRQSMSIRAIRPEEANEALVGYDLEYTLARNIRESGLDDGEIIRGYFLATPLNPRPRINKEAIDNKVIIKANQPPEVLKRIIGDDIVAILASQARR